MKFRSDSGTEPITQILENYGGWPVIKGEQWNAENIDWIELIGNMSRDGINTKAIVSISVSQDFKNSSKHILMVRCIHCTSYSEIVFFILYFHFYS